ncbi:MAG: tannase/feruloyl esterase family alpha/beta hydrolase [Betaproteobacteria bacterium]|nr:tannase/feruloyl esterase family alpha/beta hydrolase [Betaproteobacteria bacterium]
MSLSMFRTATNFVPARGNTPAFCQVVGTFVTNPATGKTAGFLATFPANWNGRYLQSGCSGHCGQVFVSNPATPAYSVTGQGENGAVIRKGYAHFATDEGHTGMDFTSWAIRSDGSIDQDAVTDWAWRADKVLAKMGKELTTAFYAKATGARQPITHAYFNGCSGGGRDALVAASYFPNEFDGIIAGSPYDPIGVSLHSAAIALTARRNPGSGISTAQLGLMDSIVKAQCDGLDGVKDGIVQNPAMCNFRPARDLPKCAPGQAGDACFTDGQIEMVSNFISGVTDEHGRVVQPGYSVSETQMAYASGLAGEAVQKVMVNGNSASFKVEDFYQFASGGKGPVTNFHAVVPASYVAKVRDAFKLASGHLLENTATFRASKTRMLMWHNLSDEALTPYMSINYYKGMAARYGGYAKLQQQVRLFMIPGTSHCSISGIAPNNFDALGAMENWVERGKAPDSLRANVVDRQFTPGAPKAPALAYPNATATLCKFPEMARYSGKGDVKDAANWSCSPNDKRMLLVGESGRQAGVR